MKKLLLMEKSNDRKNKITKLVSVVFVSLFVMILLMEGVFALGITPGRTTLDYEAGLEKEIELSIINNEHKPMEVALFSIMQDDLNGSLTLFKDHLKFLPSEDRKTLRYKIKLPDRMSPGLHIGEIVAAEIPQTVEGETSIGATVAVVSQIYIYVPYPGKYVEADLQILDAEQNGTATFIVPVINRGKLGIGEVRAIIDIFTPTNKKVATLETDYSSLEPRERTELVAKWQINVPAGDYFAKVNLLYDGESRRFEKPFTVGSQMLSIESILVNNFKLGEIAKLQILVENKFNQEIKSVYANLLIYNHEDQVMADIKSATEDIPPLSKKELIAYWDTVGVKEGEYDGKLIVRYSKRAIEKNLILDVKENSLDIVGLGYAIRKKPKGIKLTTILIILIVILVIANLSWFILLRRFLSKRKKVTKTVRIP